LNHGRLYLWSDGVIRVQDKGTLRTDKRDNVSNYTDAGVGSESVLTKNVRYGGGSTLNITNEGALTIEEIGGILSAMSPGAAAARAAAPTTSTRLELEAPLSKIKPSEIGGIAGMSAARRLFVKPAAAEDATTLTIPPGADIETTVNLDNIVSITVTDGTLHAPDALFPALTAITVSGKTGTLKAEKALLDVLKTLTVSGGTVDTPKAEPNEPGLLKVAESGTVTVSDSKGVEGSEVADGSRFYGSNPDGSITFKPGAVINDEEVKADSGKIKIITPLGTSGTPVALTVSAGDYVQLPLVTNDKGEVIPYYASSVSVPEGGTLSVKGKLVVTANENPTGFKGTLLVEEGGILHDLGIGSILVPGAEPTTVTPGQIVFKPGSTGIQGTPGVVEISPEGPLTVGGDGTITLNYNGDKSQAILKGTATIAGTFNTGTDNLIIEKNSTLTVAKNGGLTSDTTITGEGTLVVYGTASGMPALSTEEDKNPTGYASITISSKKDLKSGDITINLGGSITENVSETLWASAGNSKPSGRWSWAVITGILPVKATGGGNLEAASSIEIKQSNQSLHYYSSTVPAGDLSSAKALPTSAPIITNTETNQACIFLLPDGSAYKWAKYGEGRNPVDSTDNGFGVLLWSGADLKKATIEIKPTSAMVPASPYTVIVDWSELTINSN
jgi:hypothetical protein